MLWNIGLPSWVIQDGNYGDFEKGQVAEFAVEFTQLQRVEAGIEGRTKARLGSDGVYDVAGQLVLRTAKITVVDIGLLVFNDAVNFKIPGDSAWFETRVELGIDFFVYFEELSKISGVPPLIYTWRVDSIVRLGQEVPRTDAWNEDSHYTLRCELMPNEPKYTSATAAP